ncbi:MAG: hypothetical protein KA059_02660 [Elusimicrobiales bacterium]|nr:hypothetical protein [Elusimicrobiales bacterium]
MFNKDKREFLFYFLAGFLISLPMIIYTISNPDIGWHIASGRYIVENFTVPRFDFMSWTKYGTQWIDTEWLTQLIYYLVYSLDGYRSLYILKLFNMFLMGFSFSLLVKSFKVSYFNIIWLLPAFFFSAINLLDLRPDNYSVILFILLFILLNRITDDDSLSSKTLIEIAVMFILWANIHPGYTYGLIMIAIYFSGMLFNENLGYIYGDTKKIKFDRSKKYLTILITAFVSTLINPYGYQIYSVFFFHFSNLADCQRYINEWQAPDIVDLNLFYFYVFAIITIVVYLYNFLKTKKTDFIEVFLLLFFIISAALYTRLNIYAVIIVSMIFIKVFQKYFSNIKFKILCSVVFIAPFYYIFYKASVIENSDLINNKYYSSFGSYSSVDFIKDNIKYFKNLKIYNGYNVGGFLDGELYGVVKTFMDGRYLFLDMLPEHLEAYTTKDSWEKFSNKYGFDMAVISIHPYAKTKSYQTKIGKENYKFQRPYYYELFDPDKWALIYFDKRSMIIIKRSSAGADILKDNEYNLIKPYDFDRLYIDTLINKKIVKDIKKELINYIRKYNGNDESFSDVFVYIYKDMIDIEKGRFKY